MFKRWEHLYFPVFFLYILAAVFVFLFSHHERAWSHAATSALSRYMPTPKYWADFNQERHNLGIKKIEEFGRYYYKVSEFMPLLAEAHAMVGFCYFYDGKITEAQRAYQRAVDVYPKVFNFHYNLGLIALKRNDLPAALAYFKKSVAVAPLENIQFIIVSRIYHPFLPFAHQPQVLAAAMGEHTKEFYRQAYLQILEISNATKNYQTMLTYSRLAIANGILEKPLAYYYAGQAAYQLKDYQNTAVYLQSAIKQGFYYAQGFEILGMCLQALENPDSRLAVSTAASLKQKGKIFVPERPRMQLIIY